MLFCMDAVLGETVLWKTLCAVVFCHGLCRSHGWVQLKNAVPGKFSSSLMESVGFLSKKAKYCKLLFDGNAHV